MLIVSSYDLPMDVPLPAHIFPSVAILPPHASRSGTPIEIVSKVILRHANLSTTQRYLGKVSDVEALRWIENVYV